jgi:hypothetical protein
MGRTKSGGQTVPELWRVEPLYIYMMKKNLFFINRFLFRLFQPFSKKNALCEIRL